MFENISSTLQQCGTFFLAGLIMGFLYEIFRFLRMAVRHNTIAVFLEDTLYMSLWGLISFIIALSVGMGYFRIYYAVCEAFGVICYFLTAGKVINILMRKFVRRAKGFIYTIYKKAEPKLDKIYSFFVVRFKSLFGQIAEILRKVTLNRKKTLPNTHNMMYNKKVPPNEGGESNNVIKAKIRKKA